MASEPEIYWDGASGKRYKFWVHKIGYRPKADNEGVYIYARPAEHQHEAVYIGQGVLSDRFASHEEEGCVTSKGATEIHCCRVSSQDARRRLEKDLLALHTEAYVPEGCNQKVGG